MYDFFNLDGNVLGLLNFLAESSPQFRSQVTSSANIKYRDLNSGNNGGRTTKIPG